MVEKEEQSMSVPYLGILYSVPIYMYISVYERLGQAAIRLRG